MRLIYLLVFVGGLTALGSELSAARLLDPWVGNSLPVWAALIGTVLLYLSVGNWLGGWLADRDPRPQSLYRLGLWAGFLVGCVPVVSRPLLRLAGQGITASDAGLLAGSLLGAFVLLGPPMTLLGCITPYALRLSLGRVETGGRTAGSIYALSTLGSIVGALLPVLVLIPNIGTRRTFLLLALLLLLVSLGGWLRHVGRRGVGYLVLPLLIVVAGLLSGSRTKEVGGLLYERESAYNYIYVLERRGERWLKLNEGVGLQSVYTPGGTGLAGGIWDYFLVAPFFNPPLVAADGVERVLLIGLAGGTVARLYSEAFGPIPIDGVELDAAIIDVAQKWLGMNWPNLNPFAQDGRAFLRRTDAAYDVIIVDAYRPPYIPFHLTTVEFFRETRSHLTERGVFAVNVGRTATDRRLVHALAATLWRVFPSVYAVDLPDDGAELSNTLLVATVQPTQLSNLSANLPLLTQPMLVEMVRRALSTTSVAPMDGPVFTDDLAPVEQMTHGLIWSYLTGR